MAVPDFQSLMLPLLEHIIDGVEHSAAEIRPKLAASLELTEADLAQTNLGGTPTFSNRLAWAKIHLERAGLIDKTRRGWFRISDEGRRLLKANPSKIDLRLLDQYEGHLAFRNRLQPNEPESTDSPAGEELTPEDQLDSAYQQIQQELASEILRLVMAASPAFLEKLVVELMLRMGYGGVNTEAGFVTPMAGDEGVDGIINEDRLGLDVIYLQAKRWERPVGRPEIQKFVGALHGKRARKGVFITTSSFTQEAVDYVRFIDSKVVLIDGLKLAEYMIEFNLGVSPRQPRQIYELKQVDSDFFAED